MTVTSRARPLLAVLVLMFTVFAVPLVHPQAAQAYACRSTDRFTGNVTQMEHYLSCNHIPYDVYTVKEPSPTTSKMAPATTVRPMQLAGGPGGPSCEWLTKNLVKRCYSHGVGHLICAQYFSGTYYPYHCGPMQAYNITHAEGMWSVVKRIFTSHAAQACVRGTVGGTVTAVILKTAGSATGIGIAASLAGGCVGGIVNYFWRN